jgi:phosphohistidine phosphatase
MRRLLLLRHAKAERSIPGGSDHERALTERGRSDARKLGAYLARHALTPDLAVVSSAARTRQTWDMVAAALSVAPPVQFDRSIYDATPEAILQAIKDVGPAAPTLLVIGHNPSLQELAAMLVASGDVETREQLSEGFPTSALAVIGFAFDDWSRLHPNGGRLEHFVAPHSLQSSTD